MDYHLTLFGCKTATDLIGDSLNYLAHLYLADLKGDSLIGQFLGDFVKGTRLHHYGEELQAAIMFHRKIDSFSDAHPVIQACRNRFNPPWRRFAGVIVDVCYDHFLVRDWKTYSDEPLNVFSNRIYGRLQHDSRHLAGQSALVLSRMVSHDWFGSYYHLEKVGLALDRIAGRLTRGALFKGSLTEVKSHYHDLRKDFQRFFPDLIEFAHRYVSERNGTDSVW